MLLATGASHDTYRLPLEKMTWGHPLDSVFVFTVAESNICSNEIKTAKCYLSFEEGHLSR